MDWFFYLLDRSQILSVFFKFLACLNSKNIRGLLIWKKARIGNQLKQISEKDTTGHQND